MATANTITVTGNITRDPEVKALTNTTVAKFGLAHNRSYKKDDEWETETSFFNVTSWGGLAENVGDSVSKGDMVTVVGRLKQGTYEDKDGNERQSFDIIADDVAVSLLYATAEVTKVEKGEKSSKPSKGRKAPAETFDEEPF